MAPFRRLTDPVLVPVGLAASSARVPFFSTPGISNYNSFMLVNPNDCYVRFQGYKPNGAIDPADGRVKAGVGWLLGPGLSAIFATQQPAYVSALAMDTPSHPLAALSGFLPLEMVYGYGDVGAMALVAAAGTGGGGSGEGGGTTRPSAAGAYRSLPIGANATQPTHVLDAVPGRVFLDLKNEESDASITVNVGGAQFTLAPGGDKVWESGFVPADEVTAYASRDGAVLTVGAYP